MLAAVPSHVFGHSKPTWSRYWCSFATFWMMHFDLHLPCLKMTRSSELLWKWSVFCAKFVSDSMRFLHWGSSPYLPDAFLWPDKKTDYSSWYLCCHLVFATSLLLDFSGFCCFWDFLIFEFLMVIFSTIYAICAEFGLNMPQKKDEENGRNAQFFKQSSKGKWYSTVFFARSFRSFLGL